MDLLPWELECFHPSLNGSNESVEIGLSDYLDCTAKRKPTGQKLTIGLFAVDIVFLIILFFFQKRKFIFLNFLNGRPGISYPLDYFFETRNRIILGLLYGAVWYQLWALVSQTNDEITAFNVISLIPPFLGITSQHSVGYVIAVVCLLGRLVNQVYFPLSCANVNLSATCFLYLFINYILTLPTCLGVTVALIGKLIGRLRKHGFRDTFIPTSFGNGVHRKSAFIPAESYVRWLMLKTNHYQRFPYESSSERTGFYRIRLWCSYFRPTMPGKTPGFYFPITLISAMASAGLIIVYFSIEAISFVITLHSLALSNPGHILSHWSSNHLVKVFAQELDKVPAIYGTYEYLVKVFCGLFYAVVISVCLLTIYNMYQTLHSFERDALAVYRGTYKHISKKHHIAEYLLLNYSNFFPRYLAFVAFGFIFQLFAFLIFAYIATIIGLAITTATGKTIIDTLIFIVCAGTAVIILYMLLYPRIFLQTFQGKRIFEISNYRFYCFLQFLISILATSVNILMCLAFRVISPFFVVVSRITRPDLSVFPEGSLMDDMFIIAYSSLLYAEHCVRNPIKLMFVKLLLDSSSQSSMDNYGTFSTNVNL